MSLHHPIRTDMLQFYSLDVPAHGAAYRAYSSLLLKKSKVG